MLACSLIANLMTGNGPISSPKRPLAMLAAASGVHHCCSPTAQLRQARARDFSNQGVALFREMPAVQAARVGAVIDLRRDVDQRDAALTPRSRTNLTASSLNSRVNFLRCILSPGSNKHPSSASTEPAAARKHPARRSRGALLCPGRGHGQGRLTQTKTPPANPARFNCRYCAAVACFRNSMTLAMSSGFFRPGNAILLPGT